MVRISNFLSENVIYMYIYNYIYHLKTLTMMDNLNTCDYFYEDPKFHLSVPSFGAFQFGRTSGFGVLFGHVKYLLEAYGVCDEES